MDRMLEAFLKFVLVSALVHLSVLAVILVLTGDITYFNYFEILELEWFFPGISEGLLSQVLSAVTMVVLYAVTYFYFTKPKG